MTDLDRFRAGESDYWDEVVARLGPLVLDVARRFGRDEDEAEELFQEAWVRAFAKRRTFKGDGSLRAWLLVLTRNICLTRLKSERRRTHMSEHLGREPQESVPGPEELVERRERRGILREALARLPRRQREALTLRVDGELRTVEIAQRMRVTEATVRSLISKGTARLLEEVETAP